MKKYLNLLERQIKRNLKEDIPITPDLDNLLTAINRSYEHYERDHLLAKQSLEISTLEMRELAEKLLDKEGKIRAILASAFDGIIVTNENQEIELCNTAAMRYLGFENIEKLVGKKISIVQITDINTSEKVSWESIFSATAQQKFLYEFFIFRHDKPLPIELSVSDIKIGEKNLKVCVLRDISNRKQSEKKIALRHQITRLLLESPDLENAAPKVLTAICSELGWDIAFFWLKENEFIKPTFFHQNKTLPYLDDFINKTFKIGLPITEEIKTMAAEKKDPCFFSNINESTRFTRREGIYQCAFQSYLGVPIYYEDESLGVIELFTQKSYQEDPQLIKILQDIGSEIGFFIEHLRIRQRERDLQGALVKVARQAGMTQVATSVLHNVGNMLNTVNISANILQEKLSSSELDNLSKVAKLLDQHKGTLGSFISENPKGKLIPEYLIALANWWKKEREQFRNEIHLIVENIDHINNVIRMQQALGGLVGIKEKVSLGVLLDSLLTMHFKDFEHFGIQVKKEYSDDLPDVNIDRTRLLQILENLIRNAIDALGNETIGQKILTLRIALDKDNFIIEVSDNGCGIDKKNLVKIFSYGFTTKIEGHGYGLHSSALIAKELGGQISVESRGVGLGATFKLTFPA